MRRVHPSLISHPSLPPKAEQQWKRFKELEKRCEKLLEAKDALERVRAIKDAAATVSRDADQARRRRGGVVFA